MLAEIKGLNEECGIFGIWGHENAAQLTYYGLHSLQHRGQEGAGIVVVHQGTLQSHKGLGLVTEVFHNEVLQALNGAAAIGHVRYSTAGEEAMKTSSRFCSARKREALPLPITAILRMQSI